VSFRIGHLLDEEDKHSGLLHWTAKH